ncbi:protein takeout-like [Schistocerca serialis cubense]|uniref:protein takeout-like n=1 Tax=Schistocerca serialis cubense TaxID=2023355 RepID=UPI00214DF759|nr:protein takeout-like [Schistocerca serialis cubense]
MAAACTVTLVCGAALLLAPLRPAAAAHLPPDYPVCKRDSPDVNDCLKKALAVVVKLVAAGIPSLGVVPVDPLDVPLIEISDGTKNINLRITFRNVRVTGLSQVSAISSSLDLANNKLELSGVEPHLVFEADYEMSGKFLVVPVEGSGRCRFIFTNLTAELKLISERQMKGNQEYWDLKQLLLNIPRLERFEVNFENLFNGDQTLGPGFNRLLNENWIEFWGALRPTFEESFGLIFKSLAANVFGKVPLDEVFLPK